MTRLMSTARLAGLSATMALMMGVTANVASAAPIAPASAVPAAAADIGTRGDLVEQVRYRGHGFRGGHRHHRHYGGRHRGRGWVGPAIIGSAIIGSAIAASRSGYASGYNSRRQQCADTYRSFDWDSGTYQPFNGPRQLCPYLR